MAERPVINTLTPLVLSAIFAALIAVGAFIQFALPFSPVPITLQTLFVLCAGIMLKPKWAAASVALYVFSGLIGLPVFAGGGRGFAVLMGPSGGFLLSFIPAALVVSVVRSIKPGVFMDIIALVSATALIYAIGYPWIVLNLGWEWRVGLTRAVLLYLPGDAVKIAAAAFLSAATRRMWPQDA